MNDTWTSCAEGAFTQMSIRTGIVSIILVIRRKKTILPIVERRPWIMQISFKFTEQISCWTDKGIIGAGNGRRRNCP